MVSPIYIIGIALGAAFLLPLFEKAGKKLAQTVLLFLLLALVYLPLSWLLVWFQQYGILGMALADPIVVETIGFPAPLSINLQAGFVEALVLAGVNTIALLGGFYFLIRKNPLFEGKVPVLFLTLLIGVNGLIMTRDLFNIFVFMEITSISLYALIASKGSKKAFEAGFKYIIAGSIASAFYLIGVIYLYRFTGTLSLDQMLAMVPAWEASVQASGIFGGMQGLNAALFMLLLSLLIELKPFPANGWALDAYEAADPGVSALVSSLGATGIFFVLYKLMPLFSINPVFEKLIMGTGAVTFVFSQIIALRQRSARRMLGYSSVGQIGLLLVITGMSVSLQSLGIPSYGVVSIMLMLLVNHMFSKAGLFWMSDLLKAKRTGESMAVMGSLPGLSVRTSREETEEAMPETGRVSSSLRVAVILVLGLLVASLAGLPPFPAFWAKWLFLNPLASAQQWWLIGIILFGSLCEAAYLFRWFIGVIRNPEDPCTIHAEVVPEDTIVTTSQTGSVTSARGKAALERAKEREKERELAMQQAAQQTTQQETVKASASAGIEVVLDSNSPDTPVSSRSLFAPTLASLILLFSGAAIGGTLLEPAKELLLLIPVLALILGGLFDLLRIPFKVQLLAAIGGVGFYAYILAPLVSGIPAVFGAVFILGSFVQLFMLFQRKGNHPGLAALLTAMIFSLGNLLLFTSRLGLFFSWEMMTVTSFLLILRGKKSAGAGYRYLLFSLGGAYSILAGLLLLPGFTVFTGFMSGDLEVFTLNFTGSPAPLAAVILLALGILVKLGTIGVHIWLPGAYAEAEDEISSFLSSILSKAGLLLLFLTAGFYIIPVFAVPDGQGFLANLSISYVLGWLGAFTALLGAFLALFQEDIKYTLAYSSMGQVGYMLLSFAIMTQIGWVSSLYLAVTHVLFKGMLFIAIAGVISKTGTRMMYQMGGLITRMPITFISVLIGIIALSGVPPLTGFGAKWLLYTALLERGWYLQAGVAMFASAIAFLYLFRLIHVIFLGQLKDAHREISEASIWYLLPQIAGIIGIMAVSMFPNLLIQPLQEAVAPFFGQGLTWEGYTVFSALGYWNGNAVMYVTIGVFAAPLAWLLIMQRKHTYKVKQFNIVFAAERPDKPHTTHYGYNFFSHYQSALGRFLTPWATRFWESVTSTLGVVGSVVRRLYSGNGQTYALQLLLYSAVLLLILRGGF